MLSVTYKKNPINVIQNPYLKSKKLQLVCLVLLGTVTHSLPSMGSIREDLDRSTDTHQMIHVAISEPVKESFTYLMPDNHLEHYMTNGFNFRRRGYGTGSFKEGVFTWNKETSTFTQSETKNAILETLKKRKFESIEPTLHDSIQTDIIMPAYACIHPNDYKVGVHQIRIIANTRCPGKPTPEGIHHDGVDYVAVACISTHNVSGGISFILDGETERHIHLEHILTPGELLIFNDKPVAHHVSDITPKLPGFAHRDVIVTTFKVEAEDTPQDTRS